MFGLLQCGKLVLVDWEGALCGDCVRSNFVHGGRGKGPAMFPVPYVPVCLLDGVLEERSQAYIYLYYPLVFLLPHLVQLYQALIARLVLLERIQRLHQYLLNA